MFIVPDFFQNAVTSAEFLATSTLSTEKVFGMDGHCYYSNTSHQETETEATYRRKWAQSQ